MAQVLLVEVEITVLIVAESVLQGLGHSALSAGSQTEAVALFDDPGGVDVLFTDIRLLEGDLAGFELAKQARERNPSLKVLYTTGETLTDRMKALYAEGASMLPKPYTDIELKGAIEAIISGT
jgi:CheY-like chemotaxis protein